MSIRFGLKTGCDNTSLNDSSEQASPMTEGVVEIRISMHLVREIT
jgi:hypothetical protein